jgi:diaminopimelate decarboxylase
VKPLGPIPDGFGTIDGELAIAGRTASAIADGAGETPLFVYSRAIVAARVARLKAAMPPRLALHYAVKANSYAPLLEHMRSLVDGFDIASAGEMAQVIAAGVDPAGVSFAGPGKRDAELEAAVGAGVTLNLESANEARRAVAIAERLGTRPRLAVRVNPDFELKGSGMKMGGGAKPFGVDVDQVPAVLELILASGAEWRGFHIFAGSQALDAGAIVEAQAKTLELAARLARQAGRALPACNLGGGFGVPYFAGDTELDVETIGQALANRFDNLPQELEHTQFCIELGRWLVGPTGVYLTRVVDRKDSHGEVFLVVDGGLHHQLAASGNFGTVVRRNYPVAIATRFAEPPTEQASVVGCLCTPLDRLADQAGFPRAEVGDLVAVFQAGAYGASASPAGFLGHGPAKEILV